MIKRKWSKFICTVVLMLCALIAMSGCNSSVASVPLPGSHPINVLCFGDSNTYGFNPEGGRYPTDVRWTCLLADKLGANYNVIAEGMNGRTTAFDYKNNSFGDGSWGNGLKYIIPCVISNYDTDIMIIMLGSNDVTKKINVPASEIAGGLEKLILATQQVYDTYGGKMPKLIIVAPAAIKPDPDNDRVPNNLDKDAVSKSHELAPLYEEIAHKYNCEFIDATHQLEVSDIDRIHLTPDGHKKLAQLLYDKIMSISI